MPIRLGFLALVATLAGLITASATAVSRGSESAVYCRVKTTSGRMLFGEIGDGTNERVLRLRSSSERATIERSIAWPSVAEGWIEHQPFSTENFKQAALRCVSKDQKSTSPSPAASRMAIWAGEPEVVPPTAAESRAESLDVSWNSAGGSVPLAERGRQPSRARSVTFDATVANWDGDVESDGILLWLQPLDEYGQLVAARGTLTCDLTGNWPATIYQPQPLSTLARWSRAIDPHKLSPRGYLVRLEFQALHPDFQTNVGPYALLHCSLSVPGVGTFDETVSLRIRSYNPLRDQLQKFTGSRFVAGEMLGRRQ